eukprot:11144338-Lingulodinium_polyedra.AAC.1
MGLQPVPLVDHARQPQAAAGEVRQLLADIAGRHAQAGVHGGVRGPAQADGRGARQQLPDKVLRHYPG